MSDVWLVFIRGAERTMTLDELDAAYQSELIDDRTLVRQPGTPWRSLGSLLGVEPPTAHSVRPVSIDLETDTEMPKTRSRRIMIGMPAAALVVCGTLLAVSKLVPPAEAPKAAAGAAAVMVAPPPATTPAPPPPVVDKPVLSTVQKDALLRADQDREKKLQKAKETKKTKAPPPSKSKPVFTKSGNKYDPLNAKL